MTSSSPSTPPSAPFTVRCEVDVLALVPFTLGFHPHESLVLVALAEDGLTFHARVDLPLARADLEVVVGHLVGAAVRNEARRAMVVVYSRRRREAEAAAGRLAGRLAEAEVPTLLQLRVEEARWFPLGDPADPRSTDGVPFDLACHPLTTQGVYEGRVTVGGREELVGSLAAGDPAEVASVAQAHAALAPLDDDDTPALVAESVWLGRAVARAVRTGVPMGTGAVARLLRGLENRDVRDQLWSRIRREQASAHVVLWSDVVRRSPEDLVASAAGVLAFAAWLSGHGALAWCAVDRALAAEPGHTLARLVGDALDGAVPPTTWRPIDPGMLRLTP